jgi:ribosomal-protein-alanine N-acetyltransferase
MAVQHEADEPQTGEPCVTSLTSDDIPAVLEIEEKSFPTPWSHRAFESEIRDNRYAEYFAARIANNLVGYAGMWVVLDEAHITNIAVHPEYRGRSIGDLLLSSLEQRARLLGAGYITLEVRPSNFIARAMYTKHGFQEVSLRKGYYSDTSEDALVMRKDL